MQTAIELLLYLGLAPLLQLLAVTFMLVSMATTYWMESTQIHLHYGLFDMCVNTDCYVINRNSRISETYQPIRAENGGVSVCYTGDCRNWLTSVENVRVLMGVSLACAIFALFLSCYHSHKAMTSKDTSVGPVLTSCFCSVVVLIMSSVSCDVFSRNVYEKTSDVTDDLDIGSSLILAATAGALSLVGGIVSIVTGIHMRPRPSPGDHLLHTPPAGGYYDNMGYGRQGEGSVNWVERGGKTAIPTVGQRKKQLPPLMTGEKSKLPPLPENLTTDKPL